MLHEVPHQNEILTLWWSSHFKFHYGICSRLIIIAVYKNVYAFSTILVNNQAHGGGWNIAIRLSKLYEKIIILHVMLLGGLREKLIFTWSLPIINSARMSACLSHLLICENSRLYQRFELSVLTVTVKGTLLKAPLNDLWVSANFFICHFMRGCSSCTTYIQLQPQEKEQRRQGYQSLFWN
jgi:hypothetical protein